MLFTDLRLQNYRSYADASFELGSGVNIVVGPNAVGKTNMLEALMLVAVGHSFRSKDSGLVRHGADWARVDVHTSDNSSRSVKFDGRGAKLDKTFEIDDKVYKRLSLQHTQPVVIFQPDDLRLLVAEPQLRRTYIDDLLQQYTPGFSTLRLQFRRALAQRNALLKQSHFSESQLFAWNIRFCEIATKLVAARRELCRQIDDRLAEIYEGISEKPKKLRVVYETKTPLENYSETLMKQLNDQLSLDRLRGFTGRGPHRDDVVIYDGDIIFSDVASRGENRSCMLALKIFELEILESKTGKHPLLLLDDVFSELDGSRRRALTHYLASHQTIITTTDADVIMKNFSDSVSNVISIYAN